ncbi:DUF2490 domain-containing protein [Aureibacter tunicatorum]|uniref:DUF2490 domain-containing protein n=1 Tax=Aureibacter tunicatorum TaxID=866807 RepID=A0AAE3XMH8_9BACT|nr:DUF2490 domain-containing protein [Aureibacter tunicatorum]MDR6240636.1 hypothetical protein [Aureibacter tunicatorum]BDD06503.1 hypothetical protein AUTU_39860 [Aureibacter tunicatorum]
MHWVITDFFPFKICLIVIALLSAHQKSIAQNGNQHCLYYFGSFPSLEKIKFSFGTGLHYVPNDEWKRLELRTTHDIPITTQLKFGFGQRSLFTHESGMFSHYELRPFQKITFNHNIGWRSKFTHRLMLEERVFFQIGTKNTFHGRIRYRLESNINITNTEKFYIRPMSEIFYSFAHKNNKYWSRWKNTFAFGTYLQNNIILDFRFENVYDSDELILTTNRPIKGFRLQMLQRF